MYDLVEESAGALPIHLVPVSGLADWLEAQAPLWRNWLSGRIDRLKADSALMLPDDDGTPAAVLAVVADTPDMWSIAGLQKRLPADRYVLDISALNTDDALALAQDLVTGWALGTYTFDRYKKSETPPVAHLVWPVDVDQDRVLAVVEATCLARTLINTPAQDMGPSALEAAARSLADRFDGKARTIVGEDLLSENFPMIHAVGRAAVDPPRLIDLTFGDADRPKVTLVGKGVCFDTGGLDLKPASGMELMRKDMGGAATVLGLAHLILALDLPVRLRVLIPAVENAVAGNAYRPGDILRSRKGLTVEIGNTDAEGRLVLGDALTLAGEEEPDLLVDFATLTGAARVAVGTEIAAFFARDNDLAHALEQAGAKAGDAVWRLPLHEGYRHMLDTPFADINNAGSGRFAGASTAALFLKEFVADPDRWLHLDIMAWNSRSRPGRPRGGEAMGLRALFRMIEDRFVN
ncbi:MAG: leucyl aminopeptidase family protein [Minwuia sp.]|nr:leucyl aminopeptidase family protein [Minwuia sp.]